MALLLKIKRSNFAGNMATVAKAKSAKDLGPADLDCDVYVWWADSPNDKSFLSERRKLKACAEIAMAQVRNPRKSKPAYEITLSKESEPAILPLLTDELEAVRYSKAATGIDTLGTLHRDRNDKIIRLSAEQRKFLESRF